MPAIAEQIELLGYLKGKSGKDLLSALPLVSSHIESAAILNVLRASCAALGEDVQKVVKRPVCLVAFGSIGRLEYVAEASDLDLLIVVQGTVTPPVATRLRSEILTPLARVSPWLGFDHRERVLAKDWTAIASLEIPYPIVGTDDLFADQPIPLVAQRRWQLLLEGRALFNDEFFAEIFDAVTPQIERHGNREVSFQKLISAGGAYFGGFDNPVFLYKSPFKYFKTRFLRDFFIFATQLTFLLGYYLQRQGQSLQRTYLRAATVNKLMRAVRFAEELEEECKKNPGLASIFEAETLSILKDHTLHQPPLLLFGAHYTTAPARLLHGLLMCVLSRFAACWEQIYDPHVRSVLATLPKELNFESSFPQQVADPVARDVLDELQQRRDSYRSYMSATAAVIRRVFPLGRVWAMATVPRWVADALKPFIRTSEAA